MRCVSILKQSLILKKINSKYRKHTQVLYLVAHIENIFIPAHYEEIIKYFIAHWKYFYANWYLGRLYILIMSRTHFTFNVMTQVSSKTSPKTKYAGNSMAVKQDEDHSVALWKWRDFLWCIKKIFLGEWPSGLRHYN